MNKLQLLVMALVVAGVGLASFAIFTLAKPKPVAQKTSPIEQTGTVAAASSDRATLEIFSQPVWVTKSGSDKKEPATNNEEVGQGDTIATDVNGRAQVVFTNHTVTRLDQNSEITIGQLSGNPLQILIQLKKNRIWSRIAKIVGLGSYGTQSPTVLATVRGTSYGHEIGSDGVDKITTTKGTVDGTCTDKPADTTNVTADHKALFDCTTDNIKPENITDADKDDWYDFNQDQDKQLSDRFGTDTYNDENVLGATTETNPSPSPATAPVENLIECHGADGGISHVTQAVCDQVNSFWASHGPSGNSSNNSSSGGSSSSNNSSNNNVVNGPAAPPGPGPSFGDINYNPLSFDGTNCTFSVNFPENDPDGIADLSINWSSVDASGAGQFSGVFNDPNLSASPSAYNANISFPIDVGPNGLFNWSIVTHDTLQNESRFDGTGIHNASDQFCFGRGQ